MTFRPLAPLLALSLLACGGNDRVDAPGPPPQTTLADLQGSWEHVGPAGKIQVTIREGDFRLVAPTAKGECFVTGTARTSPTPDSEDAWLEVKLEQDTCREPLVFRVYRAAKAGTGRIVLTEDRNTGGDGVGVTYTRVGD